MKWPDHDAPPACSRLHSWLNNQDAKPRNADALSAESLRSILGAATQSLRGARRPLIWLESTDVDATRAAVQLAQNIGASLHVARSPGAELVGNVTSSDGWLGTTFAEVGSTASLIIHLGQQHLRDAPLFEKRFASPSAQHLFLDSRPESWMNGSEWEAASMQLNWTRERWLDGLTRTLLVLRDESAATARPAEPMDIEAGMLAEMLLNNHYSVIVWSEDELSDQMDELIVRRLLELARLINRTARCSLLCCHQDPGRVTAKEAVLWLTNRTSTIQFTDGSWKKASPQHRSLQQWQDSFDWIMCIRNLPTDRQLPELNFNLVLDAHCNQAAYPSNLMANHSDGISPGDQESGKTIPVRAVGLDTSGHLLRTDHGLAAMAERIILSESHYPHAAQVMTLLGNELCSGSFDSTKSEDR